jgi:hypothetical protein
VAAFSSSDVYAVGGGEAYTYPTGLAPRQLVEHDAGTGWTTSVVPDPGGPSELSAVGGASGADVWAAGWVVNAEGILSTLLERHPGGSWSLVAGPPPGMRADVLSGLSAWSASGVFAVGYRLDPRTGPRTLIERFDGSGWDVVASPNR